MLKKISILILILFVFQNSFALAKKYEDKNMKNTKETQKITQNAGRNQLGNFAPEFAHYNDDILFGENWNNHDIDTKTRSIITMTALISQGITDTSLKYHLQNAKNHGVTKTEAAAIITNKIIMTTLIR